MAGNEAVKTAAPVEGRIDAVPAAHILAGSFHARELAEWLQQLVVVKAVKELMVGVELLAHRSFQKLDLVVVEGMDARDDSDVWRRGCTCRRSECQKWFMSKGGAGCCRPERKKSSPIKLFHGFSRQCCYGIVSMRIGKNSRAAVFGSRSTVQEEARGIQCGPP